MSKKRNVAGIIGVILDIAEQKHTEEVLRRSEIDLKSILHTTADGILAVDGHRPGAWSFN